MTPSLRTVALIGFGEVGQILARDLAAAGIADLRAYDIAFADPASRPSRAVTAAGTAAAATPAAAIRGAQLVVSAVTAAASLDAARSAAPHLERGAFFLDLNSVAPDTKTAAADFIEAGAGAYVEAAVMAAVPPQGIATPMLLGGPHAAGFLAAVEGLGFNAKVFSERLGAASSVKMCRSVMIKGLEALSMECLLAARHYGVEKDVLLSLADTFPNQDWFALAPYMIGRSLRHGRRRAEEMREVVRTVAAAGVDPGMSAATVARQDWAAACGERLDARALASRDLAELLRAIGTAAPTTSEGPGRKRA
jgi:3-hydroxyisobutyrate dehydrogenase